MSGKLTQSRIAYDRGRGKYARAHDHMYFNDDAHNAGLEAVWNEATKARWQIEFDN